MLRSIIKYKECCKAFTLIIKYFSIVKIKMFSVTFELAQAINFFLQLIARIKPSPACNKVDLFLSHPFSNRVSFSPMPIIYCLFPLRPKSGCKLQEYIGQLNICCISFSLVYKPFTTTSNRNNKFNTN